MVLVLMITLGFRMLKRFTSFREPTMHEFSDNPQIIWQAGHRRHDLTGRGIIMGILNVTPDSFSDGGQWLDTGAAISHAETMIADGAEIIDVGGESTRPGAAPVAEDEELRRVLPVVKQLTRLRGHGTDFTVSIDTMKPAVAKAAVDAGASIINDVGGLQNPSMLLAVRETGAGIVIMHMQGEPRTMQYAPHYTDVCKEVRNFFCAQLERCLASGVPAAHIAFDPGIGFGKSTKHNLALLRGTSALALPRHALVMGVSRKSFIAKCTGTVAIEDRVWPTVALTSHTREHGARVFRVHDVKPNRGALRMTEAILGT